MDIDDDLAGTGSWRGNRVQGELIDAKGGDAPGFHIVIKQGCGWEWLPCGRVAYGYGQRLGVKID